MNKNWGTHFTEVVSCYGTLDISTSSKNCTYPGILQGAWLPPSLELPFIKNND